MGFKPGSRASYYISCDLHIFIHLPYPVIVSDCARPDTLASGLFNKTGSRGRKTAYRNDRGRANV